MNRRIAHAAQIVAVVLALALVPAALAAKGGHGAGGSTGGGSSSLSLVVLDSPDGLAHWGKHVTFNVSTTASWPYVTVNCSQNGMGVLTQTAGFWPDYVWGQVFGLSSGSWTGGAADCTATLYASGNKPTMLASMGFHAYA